MDESATKFYEEHTIKMLLEGKSNFASKFDELVDAYQEYMTKSLKFQVLDMFNIVANRYAHIFRYGPVNVMHPVYSRNDISTTQMNAVFKASRLQKEEYELREDNVDITINNISLDSTDDDFCLDEIVRIDFVRESSDAKRINYDNPTYNDYKMMFIEDALNRK